MNASLPAHLNALDGQGRGLRLEFIRQGDRYAHRVLAVAGDRVLATLLESIEGTNADDLPESPALQALNIDQVKQAGGPAALIGMSGGSHWSLSVERSIANSSAGLIFDAACRVRSRPAMLASTYRLGPGVEAATVELPNAQQGLSVHAANVQFVMQPLQVDNSIVQPTITTVSGRCAVTINLDALDDSMRTMRWRYAIEMPTRDRTPDV